MATGRHKLIIQILINSLRLVSALFEPFTPSLSAKINFQMAITRDPLFFKNLNQGGVQALLKLVPEAHKINHPVILVNELSDELIDSLRTKYSG